MKLYANGNGFSPRCMLIVTTLMVVVGCNFFEGSMKIDPRLTAGININHVTMPQADSLISLLNGTKRTPAKYQDDLSIGAVTTFKNASSATWTDGTRVILEILIAHEGPSAAGTDIVAVHAYEGFQGQIVAFKIGEPAANIIKSLPSAVVVDNRPQGGMLTLTSEKGTWSFAWSSAPDGRINELSLWSDFYSSNWDADHTAKVLGPSRY
jgi:hypothetical protein